MPVTDSILRYPGGKTQLADFIRFLFSLNRLNQPIYCEPFCGGAGVAIKLLLANEVSAVVLNDYDISIYSIWKAALDDTAFLINKIRNTDITIEEWKKQRNIYQTLKDIDTYNFDLAFATLFLNRTNRSGIISGGPIGGIEQKSKYSIKCRFNKATIINKITKIARQRNRIHLYHEDGKKFIDYILPKYISNLGKQVFVFFDPPYIKKGKDLYKNCLTLSDHLELAQDIQKLHEIKWITTYDHEPILLEMYKQSCQYEYSIRYSAAAKETKKEYLFSNPSTILQPFKNVDLKII